MIYLDSAAIVKMVRREQGTRELVAWLNDRPDEPLVSSSLVEVEVPRALRRSAPQALAGVPGVITRLYRFEIDAAVRATASAYGDPLLRSLGSVLATAQLLAGQAGADPLVFVSYDQRLLQAARDLGLRAEAPGG
ncbi:type II toxin-antitoxin system VapC family toxin [Actinacidiphila sp. bgisy167]|uniref:type II toxin-antitoxin system VapC family toxin n=1 Tax=Actinacidiphila sp. bgisy167 TaxID=3413797 RepID=UPI003D71FE1F